ncbi:hypothetical protein C462_14890 [Halorubrum distributum JCM 13916]|uniref:Uncharacterized protein n=1 Tax=Halorubrum distributum JCM 13916 TaxID=1230455 RepID=M0PDM8_9EURY|nr:hypothetical protein C462_14890 [Halorubrum arcis JCM 13916]
MFVFFERVTGVQHVFVGERDCGDVCDAEVDPCDAVACCVGRFELDVTDEVEFPLVTVPDGTNVLYAVDFREINIWSGLVLTKQEV